MNQKEFIPLNEKQEEALCELYWMHGMAYMGYELLTYLETEFGKYHKHTVNQRVLLKNLLSNQSEKVGELMEESSLEDILMKRI